MRVSQTARPSIDIVMEVETGQEEQITHHREGAGDQHCAAPPVGESFDEEFLNSLPLATRDYQGVAALAAGRDRRDGERQPRGARRRLYFSNNYTVDGFNTTDPVTRTFGQNFSFNAMANVEVTTAGLGAENSDTAGGVINIVTKSGSNRFELDGGVDYQRPPPAAVQGQRATGARTGCIVGHI